MPKIRIGRRLFLKRVGHSVLLWNSGLLASCKMNGKSNIVSKYGALQPADDNNVRIPSGFRSRIIANSGELLHPDSSYHWHGAPDGASTFPLDDGGWIYISNSELDNGEGGVGVIRFNPRGDIVSGYSLLANSNRNCGGCTTPWNTWLSCEETLRGRVWECDLRGQTTAVVRDNMGLFVHESAAVDLNTHQVYLTEDETDGCFYRYNPLQSGSVTDLSVGVLEVAQILDMGKVVWHRIPDPLAESKPTRYQVENCSVFRGGEGICFDRGTVYFTTKHDDRVWRYNTIQSNIDIIYDGSQKDSGILQGVDDIICNRNGDLLIAEDGGDFQIVIITPSGVVAPIVQLVRQGFSEITGLAFSPDFTRLYFSSQRGFLGSSNKGRTYEVSGPF